MRAPLSWLREYVSFDASVDELADRLYTSSLQVDQVIDVGVPDVDGNLGRFLVGRVLAVDEHPNADRLRVCQVDVGEGDARQIVCGAWNFEAGATVAVALPGAFLPIFDQPLDERELRGQASRWATTTRGSWCSPTVRSLERRSSTSSRFATACST